MNKQEFDTTARNFLNNRLSDEEKGGMLNRIYNEAGAAEPEALPRNFISLGWSFSFVSAHRYTAMMAVLLVVFSGTAYAANGSLPGDYLYPMKTKFIEPAVTMMHFDEGSREAYKASLSEKRVLELEQLKEQGRPIDTENNSYLTSPQTPKLEEVINEDMVEKEVEALLSSESPDISPSSTSEKLQATIASTTDNVEEIVEVIPVETPEEILSTETAEAADGEPESKDTKAEALPSAVEVENVTEPIQGIVIPLKDPLGL